MKRLNKIILGCLLVGSLQSFRISNISAQEDHEHLPFSHNLPSPEIPGGGSSRYYFSKYIYVSGGKYTKQPSSRRIWQVAYKNGSKYAGWVNWTGKYKWVGYGVYNYQFTGFLNKVK